jgi:hypothetical protein
MYTFKYSPQQPVPKDPLSFPLVRNQASKVSATTGKRNTLFLSSAVAEANPNGATECALSPSILECFHSHQEQVRDKLCF